MSNSNKKSSNAENARKRYAAAAATGTAYHAPQSQTPAPLYHQNSVSGNTPAQRAMTALFTRRNGTTVPGPYPAGYSYPSAKVAPEPQTHMGSAGAPAAYPSVITRGPYPQGRASNLPIGFALGALAGQGHGYATGPMGLGVVAGNAVSGAVHGLVSAPQAVEIVGAAGDCLGGTVGCLLQGGRKSRKRKSKRKTLRKKMYRKLR